MAKRTTNSDLLGIVGERATAVLDTILGNAAIWLEITPDEASEVLRAQWIESIFRDHVSRGVAPPFPPGELHPDAMSANARAAKKKSDAGTDARRLGIHYLSLAWGNAQAAQHGADAGRPYGTIKAFEDACSQFGLATAYFWSAEDRKKKAVKGAAGKAEAGQRNREEVRAALPALLAAHVLNAAYKPARRIAEELKNRAGVRLDTKVLAALVSDHKKLHAREE